MWTRSLLACSEERRDWRQRVREDERVRREKVRREKRRSESERPATGCFECRSAMSRSLAKYAREFGSSPSTALRVTPAKRLKLWKFPEKIVGRAGSSGAF